MTDLKSRECLIGRRAFILSSASTAAAMMFGVPLGFAKPAENYSLDNKFSNIRYVITDRRIPESLVFAKDFMMEGTDRLEVTEGLTKIWEKKLKPLWNGHEKKIAGLTTLEVYECLSEQARSQWHRSVVLERNLGIHDKSKQLVSWIIE